MKTYFTRKNFIAISIIFFYLVVVLLAAICCDTGSFIKANNPIVQFGNSLGFPAIEGSVQFYIMECCFLVYILVFAIAFIYEMRLALYYEERRFSKKWLIVYGVTFVICLALALAIGLCAQYPYDLELMGNNLLLFLESVVIGSIIYIVLVALVFGVCALYVNFKNIDKPYRFFGIRNKELEALEEKAKEEEEAKYDEQGQLAQSFGETNNEYNATGFGGVGGGSGNGELNGDASLKSETLKAKEIVFPGLCSIDIINQANREEEFEDNVTLATLSDKLRKYLAKKEKLYFDIHTIRAFIAGLASSRLIILEGLSGTGKSSLARYFSDFISENSYFEPVQATWRDRTNLLGFYNDFSKTYNETEFLKRLYDATYKTHHVNIMVLDEVNISRVEYYFADFLSILEYPIDKWFLKIMQLPYDFEAPDHLEDGILKIPSNTWFIGTANKDDSTYTITDKVYDRAITILFDDQNIPFNVDEDVSRITLSYDKLMELFNEAKETSSYQMKSEDYTKLRSLIEFTYNKFDLTIGNRIMNQIDNFVPVYMACGGKKDDAIDFMFSRKVVSKLEGRFEEYIKQGLIELRSLIAKTYPGDEFKYTNHEINKLLRKF